MKGPIMLVFLFFIQHESIGIIASPTTSNLLPNKEVCGIIKSAVTQDDHAADGEFPWTARLKYETKSGDRFSCAGALISSRYILTSAHCIAGKKVAQRFVLSNVRLGSYDTKKDDHCESCVDVGIDEKIVHEEYDSDSKNQYNDIALVRLNKEVTFTDSIKPLCLPTSEMLNNTFDKSNAILAGWLRVSTNAESNILRKATLPVTSNAECSLVYKPHHIIIGPSQLCAGGEDNTDNCIELGGGPLIIAKDSNYFGIGIVSFGAVPCGKPGWPTVYTRITEYMPWIASKLRS